MILLDTNALVALLVAERAEQADAISTVLEEAGRTGDEALVCESVLVETCWVLERSYGLPRAEVADLVRGLVAAPPIRAWDAELAHAALSLMERTPSLSITDALLVSLAETTGASVLTFDRALSDAARRRAIQ